MKTKIGADRRLPDRRIRAIGHRWNDSSRYPELPARPVDDLPESEDRLAGGEYPEICGRALYGSSADTERVGSLENSSEMDK
jgi:hypothetical protein